MLVTEKEEKLIRELKEFNKDLLSTVEKLEIGISLAEKMLKNEEKLKKASELLTIIEALIESFTIGITVSKPESIYQIKFMFQLNVYERRETAVTEKTFLAIVVMYMEKMNFLLRGFKELTDYSPFSESEKLLSRIVMEYVNS